MVYYNRGIECLLRGTNWVFKSDTVPSLGGAGDDLFRLADARQGN